MAEQGIIKIGIMHTTDKYWSDYYDTARDFIPATGHEISSFLAFAPKGPRDKQLALDIGCGTGHLTRELYHRGYQKIVGIDVSSSAIKLAKSFTIFSDKLTYIHLDIEKQGFKKLRTDTYDLITCRLVFAFIDNKENFLSDITKLLTHDGAFIIITPLLENVPEHKKKIAIDPVLTNKLLRDFFHVQFYNRDDLGIFICKTKS